MDTTDAHYCEHRPTHSITYRSPGNTGDAVRYVCQRDGILPCQTSYDHYTMSLANIDHDSG